MNLRLPQSGASIPEPSTITKHTSRQLSAIRSVSGHLRIGSIIKGLMGTPTSMTCSESPLNCPLKGSNFLEPYKLFTTCFQTVWTPEQLNGNKIGLNRVSTFIHGNGWSLEFLIEAMGMGLRPWSDALNECGQIHRENICGRLGKTG